jgi:hypothetical protein
VSKYSKLKPDLPQYVPATDFYRSLALHFEAGQKLYKLGVLKPDGWLNQRPIFLADAETVERAKTAIALFPVRQLNDVKELANTHV